MRPRYEICPILVEIASGTDIDLRRCQVSSGHANGSDPSCQACVTKLVHRGEAETVFQADRSALSESRFRLTSGEKRLDHFGGHVSQISRQQFNPGVDLPTWKGLRRGRSKRRAVLRSLRSGRGREV